MFNFDFSIIMNKMIWTGGDLILDQPSFPETLYEYTP